MNKDKRKKLNQALDLLTYVHEEETESLEALPESLQYSEKGEKMQEYIDGIDTAVNEIQTILEVS